MIGSPLKKQRASMSGLDSEFRGSSSAEAVAKGLGFGFAGGSTSAAKSPAESRGSAAFGGAFGGLLEKKPESEKGKSPAEGTGLGVSGVCGVSGSAAKGKRVGGEDEEL